MKTLRRLLDVPLGIWLFAIVVWERRSKPRPAKPRLRVVK